MDPRCECEVLYTWSFILAPWAPHQRNAHLDLANFGHASPLIGGRYCIIPRIILRVRPSGSQDSFTKFPPPLGVMTVEIKLSPEGEL